MRRDPIFQVRKIDHEKRENSKREQKEKKKQVLCALLVPKPA